MCFAPCTHLTCVHWLLTISELKEQTTANINVGQSISDTKQHSLFQNRNDNLLALTCMTPRIPLNDKRTIRLRFVVLGPSDIYLNGVYQLHKMHMFLWAP